MRSVSQRMASSNDEIDRAIEKVLQNLVSKFIDFDKRMGLNQDLLQSNDGNNLTAAQKTEKKNQ